METNDTVTFVFGSSHLGTSLVAQMVKRLSTMRETWVRSLGREDPLGKEMAIHFSILAWKIPWTEEPGVTRVRHNLVTKPPAPPYQYQKYYP